jgi:hypothetical protein
VNFLPELQPRWYCTETVRLSACTVPIVKPLVRPLLATVIPSAAAFGAAQGTPMSMISPVASTAPGRAMDNAASTFPLPSGTRSPA